MTGRVPEITQKRRWLVREEERKSGPQLVADLLGHPKIIFVDHLSFSILASVFHDVQ